MIYFVFVLSKSIRLLWTSFVCVYLWLCSYIN